MRKNTIDLTVIRLDFCRYQNIQRTMATEEEGGSQRLERSSSTETDPDSVPPGTITSCIFHLYFYIWLKIYTGLFFKK